MNPTLILMLAGAGSFLFVTELVVRRRRAIPVHAKETAVSGVLGALGYALRELGGATGLVVAYGWLGTHIALWHLPRGNPLTWVAYLLVGDFAYYWVHRAEHSVRVLWASHLVHHSAEDFGFTTAVRFSPLELIYKPLTGLWAPLLGFPLAVYTPLAVVILVFGQLQHTQIVGRLGVLDKVLATPSNHRVHHARNTAYIDKNFGAMTMIWDRLFGTYVPETEPVIYGSTEPLTSRGLIGTAVGGYPMLCKALAHAGSSRDALRIALARPGSYDTASHRTETLVAGVAA